MFFTKNLFHKQVIFRKQRKPKQELINIASSKKENSL